MATIVIDAGHGPGADQIGSSANHVVGPTGLEERTLTLDIAERMQRALGGNHRIALTRQGGQPNASAAERARVAREAEADVFISVHFNGFRPPTYQASEALVQTDSSAGSRALADQLLSALGRELGHPAAPVREGRWHVLNDQLHAPSTDRCIVEVSYLSNPDEETRLHDAGYRDRVAGALAAGVKNHLSSRQPAPVEASGYGQPQARPLTIVNPVYNPTNVDEANRMWDEFLRRYGRWHAGVPDTSFFPHSAICKLVMTFPDGTYHGTGFYISSDRILTCAHNVTGASGNASSVRVMPGKNGPTSQFQEFTLQPSEWRAHESYNGSFDHDLAIMRAPVPPPNNRAFETLEALEVSRDSKIIVCGYAATSTDPWVQHLDADVIREISANGEVYSYNLQGEGGASGSPVFYRWGYEDPRRRMSIEEFRVVGVHVFQPSPTNPEPVFTGACRFTEPKLEWIRRWSRSWS